MYYKREKKGKKAGKPKKRKRKFLKRLDLATRTAYYQSKQMDLEILKKISTAD